MNTIHEMVHITNADEARAFAAELLYAFDVPHKIWEPDDLTDQISNYPEEHHEALLVGALESGYWRDLSDCSDDDWMKIELAVDEAAIQLGVTR